MPELDPAYGPVLDRFQHLIDAGLHGEAVVTDFLRHRTRHAWSYHGPSDGIRVIRGAEHDFGEQEMGVLLQALIGATNLGRTDLPAGVQPLCADPNVRRTILDSLPALDDIGLSPVQGYRDVRIGETRPVVGTPAARVEASSSAPSCSGVSKAKLLPHDASVDPGVAAAAASGVPRRLLRGDGSWVGESPSAPAPVDQVLETAAAPQPAQDPAVTPSRKRGVIGPGLDRLLRIKWRRTSSSRYESTFSLFLMPFFSFLFNFL